MNTQDGIDKDGKFYKVFVVKAEAGRFYSAEMNATGFMADVRLEDEKGHLLILGKEPPGNANMRRLDWQADAPKTYHVIATSLSPGQTGAFTLSIAEHAKPIAMPAPKGAIALKFEKGTATYQGQLASTDPVLAADKKHFKEFTFKGEAGKTYKVDLHSKDFDAFLYLKDAAGNTLIENDDNGEGSFDSRIIYRAEQTGNYQIVATSLPGKLPKTGAFVLTVVTLESGPLKLEKLVLAKEKAVNVKGQLTTKDALDSQGRYHHAYAFQAQQGKAYSFEMTGIDPFVRVENTAGKSLKEEDFGDGKVSRLIFIAPSAGTFHVIATTFKAGLSGDYTLTAGVVDLTPAKAQPIKLDKGTVTIQSAIGKSDAFDKESKYYKVYALEAQKGKFYRVEMTAKGTFDPFVRVQEPGGNILKSEETGDGKVSKLTFSPPQPGTYHIVATSFTAGTTGEFTLVVAETTGPDPKDVKPPKEVIKPIETKGTPFKLDNGKDTFDDKLTDKDAKDGKGKLFKTFPFKAEQGKTYRFEITGKGGLDPYVRVEDDKGATVKEEDFGDGKVSRVFFKCYKAGSYRVAASTFEGGTGDFTLSAAIVELKEATVQPLKLDKGKAVVNAELSTADAQLATGKTYKEYSFTGEVGKTYKIDLHSKVFDAYLYLRNAAGKTLVENDDNGESLDSRIVYTVETAGTYHILATSLGGGSGAFTLTVAEVPGGSEPKGKSKDGELKKKE